MTSRLRIGIDGYNLAMPNGTGVASYGYTLAETLRGAGHAVDGLFGIDAGTDPRTRELLFFDRIFQPPPTGKSGKRLRRRLLWQGLRPRRRIRADEVPLTDAVDRASLADRLPKLDRLFSSPSLFDVANRHFKRYRRFLTVELRDPPAIMHWTYPLPIRLAGARNIYTMHDLVPLRLPYTTLDEKTHYRALVSQCAAEAAHICTVSEWSRGEIIQLLGVPPERVTSTGQASPLSSAAMASDPEGDASLLGQAFGLARRGYFLYFGAIEPKKNIGRLVEAYMTSGVSTPLVLVTGRSWSAAEELRLLSHYRQRQEREDVSGPGRIVMLEHLPRPVLVRLIRAARGVLFPSLHEGFGLPVLEAMQLGTPVLTSVLTSLPEVAGDAALFVDPYDAAAIARGIRALDDDDALRDRLAAAGPPRAETFSRPNYAKRLDAMYARALG